MQRIMITGSSRGIGLRLVQEYLEQDTALVFATCRSPDSADQLHSLHTAYNERIRVLPLDVSKQQSIEECVQAITRQVDGLDLLINNAGILPGGVENRDPKISRFGSLEPEAMTKIFRINSISPIIVTQAFAALLRAGIKPRVINISSDAGSITLRDNGCDYGYSASKAAMNMLTRCLAADLLSSGVAVAAIHPGFVQTDMGGSTAPHTLDETVPGLMRTIASLSLKASGLFYAWDGSEIPW